MARSAIIWIFVLCIAVPAGAQMPAPRDLKDLYFGEALYAAFQSRWFDAIARLDTELAQHYRVDEPALDSLYAHLHQAQFGVGDFELAYRMHRRAGRAITAVIEGNVPEPVRNEAVFRLARIYFQKDQPVDALYAIERIRGEVPDEIRADIMFLRAQILMANDRYADAVPILQQLQQAKHLEGFATYNMGIALIRLGQVAEGRGLLERTGQIASSEELGQAIQDKANLVLGSKLLDEQQYEGAKLILDRVHLQGPFSNRALLGSGWADASRQFFEQALVPWNILVQREVTDRSVQEAMLAVPYAYGKLNAHTNAALMYAHALERFEDEIVKLDASIQSVNQGRFLKALVREELKQDPNWVVHLRRLPQTPETYYLLELMASHDFQESLKNYLDLEELRQRLSIWLRDLEAFEDIIAKRRAYFQPLLPGLDSHFRQLDSQMRLRLEQRDRIERRLQAMLTSPRPDYLATASERLAAEQISALERRLRDGGASIPAGSEDRIKRLRGVLSWNIHTDYDRRLTETYHHLHDLNTEVDALQKQYTAFVRTRQAATQSYEGYQDTIHDQRAAIIAAGEKVDQLMIRQGRLIDFMAASELSRRRERLVDYQIKARFALADSYDRATRDLPRERVGH